MENEQDRKAIKKAKVLYNSCMNESKALCTPHLNMSALLLKGGKKTRFLFLEMFIVSTSAKISAGFTKLHLRLFKLYLMPYIECNLKPNHRDPTGQSMKVW